jgi:hypothetical protein
VFCLCKITDGHKGIILNEGKMGKECKLVEASRELSISECDIVNKHNSRRCKPFVMCQVLASEGLGAKRAYLRITLAMYVISFLVEGPDLEFGGFEAMKLWPWSPHSL